ncbi:unnamed protein product (macronuclear) [Paramecium tetraurelia]|uniref:VWFA domain-containing protein n=1 Tax=Paramecium tetraurelia TaxID=5888 RepID=A0DLP1_PARTE|nr:uncharacterized protein GSPATT00039590001 [Paramecium tetraurelia]CAK83958.1 unnamed protein product [Paramecium tetraurelia]|eukprot:XP_001451355.1 hypothetical protein (macronuclear) [Paramecium tetraurelia strain d4-2]
MMAMCSKKAYLKRRSVDNKYDVDTNIFQVKFDCLKDNIVKIHQGDPVMCQQCETVLNKHSKIQEDVQNQQFGKQLWICEFCNHKNYVQIEKEEIPTNEDTIYLIQSAQEQQMQIEDADNSIIFCIDNSGSMSSTVEIKGKINFKHGISAEEYEMLKQFIEPGDEHQIWPQFNTKHVTHVSRKQCVMAAIEQQIGELKKKNPNKIVGLVTFNNEVVVYGDGSEVPITIAGDRLFKQDEIENLLDGTAKQLMKYPVKAQAETLLKKFEKLQEKGQTALGPALISALQLAKIGKPGSMIIICTDGLANLGLGSLDNDANKQFYEDLGAFASQCGVVISVVTIKGEGCKVDILGALSEKTNGTVTRVRPEDIEKDFANILKDELVGTQVQLFVNLHRALKFRGEDDPTLSNKLKRDIGNATIATTQTFEYQLKNDQELQKEQIDIKDLKNVPFQIKVNYTNLHGDRLMRVVTQLVSTTENVKEAEEEAQVEVIHKRMAQKTAQIAKKGNYQEAQSYNDQWDGYVQKNAVINNNVSNKEKNFSFQAHNLKLQTAVQKQEVRKEKVQKPPPQQQSQQQQPSFFEKVASFIKGDEKKQQQAQIPEPSQQKASIQQQDSPQLQKRVNPVKQNVEKCKAQNMQLEKEMNRKRSLSCSDDEDAEMADLFQFEQGKY